MIKKILLVVISIFCFITLFESCVYHKADQEYPSSKSCDTTVVRYAVEIKAILDANCKSCHNGTTSISGIDLYNHTIISKLALNGQFTYGTLLSAVMHKGGAPMMPQDQSMLQDCDINKIAVWVHKGAPDN